RRLRDVPRLGEAVHDAAHLLRAFLAQDGDGVLRGGAGVDHERLAALARGADVGAEALALPLEVALHAVVVEPGLADRDHLRVLRHADQLPDVGLPAIAALVGMHPGGAPDVRQRARHLEHGRKRLERGADGERVRDAASGHALDDGRKVRAQLGEVEVAMGIDQHGSHSTGGRKRPTSDSERDQWPMGSRTAVIGKISSPSEETMNRNWIPMAVAGALAAAALAAHAEDRVYRVDSDYAHPIRHAPDWNVAAADGMCRLHIWVDDRARVKLQGDRIEV